MADDTRKDTTAQEAPIDALKAQEDDRPRRKKQPRHPDFPKTQAGKLWEAFGNPEKPINEMPGGTYNTAGGRPSDLTWRDMFSVNVYEWNKLFQKPCVRDSLLVGLASGMGLGGVRAVFGGMKALLWSCNIGVLGFCSVSSGMYYWCERRRIKEAQGMAEAVAMMKRLQQKKKEEEAAQKAAEEKQRLEEAKRRSWKFW